MNFNNMFMLCQSCSDIKRANNKIYTLSEIKRNLEMFVSSNEEISNHRPASDVLYEHFNVHFMCGHCSKFPYYTLQILEENIKRLVFNLCLDIESGKINETAIYRIKTILQGNCPICWKAVDETAKRKKGEKE